jgi:hypothetical protein
MSRDLRLFNPPLETPALTRDGEGRTVGDETIDVDFKTVEGGEPGITNKK